MYNVYMSDSQKKHSILLVDDDTFLLDMYSTKFKEKGFDIQVASNAEDALALLKDGLSPTVIALDVVMPTMNGLELLEHIKNDKLAKDSVVIMLSNQGGQSEIDKALSLGAKGYIIKASAIPSEVYEKVMQFI